MGQHKYTNKNIIWRNRVPYPSTTRNLKRSRKSFLREQGYMGGHSSRRRPIRKLSRSDRQAINSFIGTILSLIVFSICFLIILGQIILLTSIFLVEFFIKSCILAIKRIKNKKIKVFEMSKFELKLGNLMHNSLTWLYRFPFFKKTKKSNVLDRTCIICGNPLRTRIKYCSKCRPSGKSKPYY